MIDNRPHVPRIPASPASSADDAWRRANRRFRTLLESVLEVVGERDGRFVLYTLEEQAVLAQGDAGLPRDLRWNLVNTRDADGDGNADVMLRLVKGEWKVFFFGDDLEREAKGPVAMKADVAWGPVED